jgi:tetratricopeptide (TPR) repeat protein
MKKITISLVFLIFLNGLFQSCSTFLEENPVDRFTTLNFYSDQNDAEAAVTAIYERLYAIYTRNMYLMSDLPADDLKNGIAMGNSSLQDLEYLRQTSQNQFCETMWQLNYDGIARANTAIQQIPGINMDEILRNRLIGEARFLRALYYFNLVRFFGDIPLILKIESLADALVPRTPKDQVYQQIIEDLTFAENNLPATYPTSETGRATKGAAKILLGKVYLTNRDYQKSASKLQEVIENESAYGYGLHDNFGSNWEDATENGKEMVLSIEFMDPPGRSNSAAMVQQGPRYALKGGFAVLGLSKCNEADIPTIDLYKQYLNEDERKAETLRTEFISLKDGSVHIAAYPIFVKYWEENEPNTETVGTNFFIIRYADAILMYAEALNEIGQTTKAHTYLNRIRERAFNSSDFNYTSLAQDDFRTVVYKERRLELALEGHRWFDLVRTGRFIDQMKQHSTIEAGLAESNKTQIGQNIKDYMVLMPIPQREIDLNKLIVQNPGY